jgi:hypothetical protein
MASQPMVFKKSGCDFADSRVTATASQSSSLASMALNRSNYSAWITTGSVDADNTTWEVDMIDSHDIDAILILGHNFKAYTVKYWDGAAYQDFSSAISESSYATDNSYHAVIKVSTSKIKLTITGTQIVNSDKVMRQFIATELMGQFESWFEIVPEDSRNRIETKMLSGKRLIREKVGFYSAKLKCPSVIDDTDLTLIEDMYFANEGFLFWPCGNDETQFSSVRRTWQKQDIFLCKCKDEYGPSWRDGFYRAGQPVTLDLIEVVD